MQSESGNIHRERSNIGAGQSHQQLARARQQIVFLENRVDQLERRNTDQLSAIWTARQSCCVECQSVIDALLDALMAGSSC